MPVVRCRYCCTGAAADTVTMGNGSTIELGLEWKPGKKHARPFLQGFSAATPMRRMQAFGLCYSLASAVGNSRLDAVQRLPPFTQRVEHANIFLVDI
jgi:hypothetical protein